jgi:hypothetical protein
MKYFMLQRRKELRKLQVRLQATITIQAKTSPSKEIPKPTTSFGEDSHEDSITFHNSPHCIDMNLKHTLIHKFHHN